MHNLSQHQSETKGDQAKIMNSSSTYLVEWNKKQNTRWFEYDRDWFVCKQVALRSSGVTLSE
jgi:hypothetical protein